MKAAAARRRAAPRISRALLTGALAIVLVCAGARPAEAQDTGLSKSELVRLVVSTDSPDAKIRTVRTRCLSFEPTEGDWRDLRNLGASEELISAAQQCAREAEAVQVALNVSSSSVRAGDTTLVTVDLTRAGTALSGQAVTLTGSGGPGSGTRYDRTTNSRGRAFFSLPGGERTGSTRYTVSASGIDLQGPTRITVTTRADVPARATLEPASIDLSPDEDPPEVAVSVEDRFGNPVGGIELELLGGPEPDAPVLATATTDAGGRAGLTAEQRPTGITTWSVRADGEVLASLPVQGPAPAAAGVAAAAPRNVEPADDAAVRAGDESLAAGDPVAAEQSYRAALGISPRRTDAQKGLAAALLAQGRANEAATWYEVATRGSPTDADAWDGLGQAYAAAGRRDDAAQAFGNNQLDAFWLFTAFPSGAVIMAAQTNDIDLVDLSKDATESGFFDKYPYFSKLSVPAGTYRGVDHDTASFQDAALWVANADVPDDVVYKLLSLIYTEEGLAHMREQKKTFKEMSVANGVKGIVTPLHPGAAKFWKEKGLI